MKTLSKRILAGSIAAFLGAPASQAVFVDVWLGTSDGTWGIPGNWSDNFSPGVGNTVSFQNAGNGNTNIDLGSWREVGFIGFDTASAAAYTIGSGGVGNQTLYLDPFGTSDPVSTVTMTSSVAQHQLVNAHVVLNSTIQYDFL